MRCAHRSRVPGECSERPCATERDPGPTARIAKRIYSCRPGSRVSLRSPGTRAWDARTARAASRRAQRTVGRHPDSLCQTACVSSFPRRAAAPGFCPCDSVHPSKNPQGEGWAERRQAHYLCCRVCETRRSARVRRGAPHDAGRSPLGAPPWRFSAGGRASISGISSGSVQRCSSQPGRHARRAVSRTSRGKGSADFISYWIYVSNTYEDR